MIAAAYLAALVLHNAAPSPLAQLATAERLATFRVVVLPSSTQLLHAAATPDGSAVRIAYSVEGAEIVIEERPASAAAQPAAVTSGEVFSLDGYAATYDESTAGRGVRVLTWYRPDLTVTVSSRDAVSTPLLIDIALELR